MVLVPGNLVLFVALPARRLHPRMRVPWLGWVEGVAEADGRRREGVLLVGVQVLGAVVDRPHLGQALLLVRSRVPRAA